MFGKKGGHLLGNAHLSFASVALNCLGAAVGHGGDGRAGFIFYFVSILTFENFVSEDLLPKIFVERYWCKRETDRPSSPLTVSSSSGYATAQLSGFGTLTGKKGGHLLGNAHLSFASMALDCLGAAVGHGPP